MLGKNRIVGFIPTSDMDRSKRFYVEALGLEYSYEDQFALELNAGQNRVRVAKTKGFTPQAFTILGWEVTEIDQTAASLQAKGVVFERFQGLPQNERGIWDSPSGARVAWFKDPDGNLLSISQHAN